MNSILMTLKWIYENLPLLLAIGATGIGIGLRIRKFIRMSKEEKEQMLKEQSEKIVELVQKQLLSMVSSAEEKWGDGTGVIKNSEVWEMLLKQYGKVADYIEMGLIDKQLIDDLIDEAVEKMQHIIDTNKAAAAVIKKQPELQKEKEQKTEEAVQ